MPKTITVSDTLAQSLAHAIRERRYALQQAMDNVIHHPEIIAKLDEEKAELKKIEIELLS